MGKGSMRTAVGHGLVGPKRSGDAVPRVHDCAAGRCEGLLLHFVPMSRGFPPDSAGRGGELVATRACFLQSAGDGGPPLGARFARGRVAEGRRARQRKGTRSRFLDRDGGACETRFRPRPHHGDVNEPRDIDGGPGEGSLPSLTVLRSSVPLTRGGRSRVSTDSPGIDSLGDRAGRLAEHPGLRGVRSAFADP